VNARTQTPELAKHLRSIEEDNRRDREWMADDRLEEIIRLCGFVDSHMICAGQAAWRGDQGLLGYHLRHAWDDLKAARMEFKGLPSEASESPV
jgi:hypothetical protein